MLTEDILGEFTLEGLLELMISKIEELRVLHAAKNIEHKQGVMEEIKLIQTLIDRKRQPT
jgi:hypothetical protein